MIRFSLDIVALFPCLCAVPGDICHDDCNRRALCLMIITETTSGFITSLFFISVDVFFMAQKATEPSKHIVFVGKIKH